VRIEGTGVGDQRPARLTLLAAIMIVVPQAFAQQPPFSPPPQILRIDRESVKPGRRPDILAAERKSVEEQVRLHSPHAYLTIASASGPDQIWYLHGGDSYGFFEQELARVAQTPGLLDAWARAAAQTQPNFVEDPRTVFARFREDLSCGHGLTGARTRYFLITTVTVRPGHRADFAELRKTIRGALERTQPSDIVAVYQVESGLRDGTFLIFSPAANLDEAGAIGQFESDGIESTLTEAARTRFRTLSDSAIFESETMLFQVSPEMSLPAKEWIEGDPEFWSANPVSGAAAPGAAK
jgi:hypothetical protein